MSRAKGNRNQRKCITALEEQGWLVSKVEAKGKFVKEKDMFGLFDLCCVKGSEVLFVQVTSNRPHPHKQYQKFSEEYTGATIQQWVWVDYKGWRQFEYHNGTRLHRPGPE